MYRYIICIIIHACAVVAGASRDEIYITCVVIVNKNNVVFSLAKNKVANCCKMMKFARIAWQKNKFGYYNNFATVEVEHLLFEGKKFTPKTSTDYEKEKLYCVNFCGCDIALDPESDELACGNPPECPNVQQYRCQISCLAGLCFERNLEV